MDFSNCIELYEAIFLFQKLKHLDSISNEEVTLKTTGVNDAIRRAIIRILVSNELMEVTEDDCYQSVENINYENEVTSSDHYQNSLFKLEEFSAKAFNSNHSFFKQLSDFEYDIYSRWNFEVNQKIGEQIIRYIEFDDHKVLELGGNSGGLATSILKKSKKCSYTIVDNQIPCRVGNELKSMSYKTLRFIENDILKLEIPNMAYDYIILMNLIHDFNDEDSQLILENAKKYSHENTEIIIIEDILNNEFEPKEVVLQGLRLSVECKGGRQRTLEEMIYLLSTTGYKLVYRVIINNFQIMMKFKQSDD